MFSPFTRFLFWSLVANFLLLTWLGRCPAESPYTEVALYSTISYFFLVRLSVSWSHIISYLYLKS
jgi:quinol-cytochrome oxidoreductase complex cytochrome b subunit